MRSKNVQVMVETALLVGAGLLLAELRLFRMPYGGSISLDMVPIFILAFRRGGKMGMLGGALVGLLKLMISGYYVHPVQILMDYPLPFMLLGVAGFGWLREQRVLGVAVGSALRYLTHVISGVVFFAEYAPEGSSVLGYSLVYNAWYLVPSAAVTAVIIVLLSRRREIFEAK